VLIVKAKQASCYTAKKLNYLHKKRHCSFSEVSLLVVKLGSLHFFTCPFSFQVYVQIFSEKDIMESMINLSEIYVQLPIIWSFKVISKSLCTLVICFCTGNILILPSSWKRWCLLLLYISTTSR
jgi:hypothetical protein